MDIKEQREIIDAASLGPWERDNRNGQWAFMPASGGPYVAATRATNPNQDADATFIAAAREEWPKALDLVEQMGRQLEFIYAETHDPNIERLARAALAAWQAQGGSDVRE